MTESAKQPPETRPLRLTRVGALAVLAFLIGGVIYLVARNSSTATPEVEVLVPVRDIQPYQVIAPQDVTVRLLRVEPGRTYLRDRDKVENRYALAALARDRPIASELLGPSAPNGLSQSLVFTVEGGAGVSLAGQLGRGSRVDVLLPGAARIENVFVLDVRTMGTDRWAVTMSVERSLSAEQAAMLAEGKVSIVRRAVGG
jgi:Flp pilus assembly protein CpaB